MLETEIFMKIRPTGIVSGLSHFKEVVDLKHLYNNIFKPVYRHITNDPETDVSTGVLDVKIISARSIQNGSSLVGAKTTGEDLCTQ